MTDATHTPSTAPLQAESAASSELSGLNARTVRNLRTELGHDGLLRSKPERDETGAAKRWHVLLTEAAQTPLARGGTGSRDVACSSRDLDATTSPDHLDHDFTTSREDAPDWSESESLLTEVDA